MKRRVISPERLLIVAAGLGLPACAAPSPKVEPPAPPPVVAEQPPMPPLEALGNELGRTTLDAARANEAHFRPLCDAEGYPLVGNTIQKTMGSTGLTATTFCTDLRARSTRS